MEKIKYTKERVNKIVKNQSLELREAMKTCRQGHDLSQEAFAEKYGIKKTTVSRLEGKNGSNPTFNLLLYLHLEIGIDIPMLTKTIVSQGQAYTSSLNSEARLKAIGREITKNIKKKGIVTRDFKDVFGVSAGKISNIMGNDFTNISFSSLIRVVLALDLDISPYFAMNWVPSKFEAKLYEEKLILLPRTRKEDMFNFILLHRLDALKFFRSTDLVEMTLERHFDKRRFIDLYGMHKVKKLPIFIESQLTPMDLNHFRQIKKLIMAIKEGIIVWISTKYDDKFNIILQSLIQDSNKKIEIHIVELNYDFLNVLKVLDSDSPITSYKKFMSSAFTLPKLQIMKTISTLPDNYIGSLEEQRIDYHRFGNNNHEVLKMLRESCPFILSLFTSRNQLNQRTMRVASGINGIDIVLSSSCDHESGASITVYCYNKKSSIANFSAVKLKLLDTLFTTSILELDERNLEINYGNANTQEKINSNLISDASKVFNIFNMYKQSLKEIII